MFGCYKIVQLFLRNCYFLCFIGGGGKLMFTTLLIKNLAVGTDKTFLVLRLETHWKGNP